MLRERETISEFCRDIVLYFFLLMESVICDLETLEAGLVAEAFCHGITGGI